MTKGRKSLGEKVNNRRNGYERELTLLKPEALLIAVSSSQCRASVGSGVMKTSVEHQL